MPSPTAIYDFSETYSARSPKVDRNEAKIYTPQSDYITAVDRTVDKSIGFRSASVFDLDIYPGGQKFSDPSQSRVIGEQLKPFVESLTIEEDEQMACMITLEMQNIGFELSKKRLLREGDQVVASIGYGNAVFDLNQRFHLVRSHPKFPESGDPKLTYKGYDGRFAMINKDYIPKKRKRGTTAAVTLRGRRKGVQQGPTVFKNKTDSQIIDDIAKYYGYAVDLDPTTKRRNRTRKKDTSHWQFILELLKANPGYTTWVDWTDTYQTWCIHFRKKEIKFTQGYDFHYNKDQEGNSVGTLLSFFPTRDTSRQVTDIEVVHFDKNLRSVDFQYVSQEEKGLPPLPSDPDDQGRIKEYGAQLKFKVEGRMIDTYSSKPFRSKEEAKKYALYLVNEYQTDFMPAEGVLVGLENVRPRQIHKISGVDEYSGEYYFTQTKHLITANDFYKTNFVCYKVFDNSYQALLKRGQIARKF
jgi:phage protein D